MNASTNLRTLLFLFFLLISVSTFAQNSVRKIVKSYQEIFEIGDKTDSGKFHLQTGLVFCEKDSIKRFFINQRKERLARSKYVSKQYSETPLRNFTQLCEMAKKYGYAHRVQYDTSFLHFDKKNVE